MDKCSWKSAIKELPPKNEVVLLRTPRRIEQAQYGKWQHERDGEYKSWHFRGSFIDYLSEWQYWMKIPELP